MPSKIIWGSDYFNWPLISLKRMIGIRMNIMHCVRGFGAEKEISIYVMNIVNCTLTFIRLGEVCGRRQVASLTIEK